MDNLPFLVDADEAIEHYTTQECTDAEKAYVVAFLSNEGFSNKSIRQALRIKKVYTVTHLKRAGNALSEIELNLWHSNPTKITLGHVRAIARFPHNKREELLRAVLASKTPVHRLEAIAKGNVDQSDTDIKRYENLMSEVLCRQVKISYNAAKQSGSLTLDFFSLDDLDHIATSLGFNADEHF